MAWPPAQSAARSECTSRDSSPGGCAAERDLQPLERQQDAAQLRKRPFRALRGDRDPALLAREQVEDEARLAPVVVVQDVGCQRGVAGGAARHAQRRRRAPARAPRLFIAVGAQVRFVVGPAAPSPSPRARGRRCASSRRSSSWRASEPIRFSRSPPVPMIIPLCASRSTTIVAAIRRRPPSSS